MSHGLAVRPVNTATGLCHHSYPVCGRAAAGVVDRDHEIARIPVEAIASLPLVLPPTVVGFYILTMSGRDTLLGSVWESLVGSSLPFSFAGILLGSVLYNLPFIVRPFMASLSRIDWRLWQPPSLGQAFPEPMRPQAFS